MIQQFGTMDFFSTEPVSCVFKSNGIVKLLTCNLRVSWNIGHLKQDTFIQVASASSSN